MKILLKDFPVALLVREGAGADETMHEFAVWAPKCEEGGGEDWRCCVSDEWAG